MLPTFPGYSRRYLLSEANGCIPGMRSVAKAVTPSIRALRIHHLGVNGTSMPPHQWGQTSKILASIVVGTGMCLANYLLHHPRERKCVAFGPPAGCSANLPHCHVSLIGANVLYDPVVKTM